MFAADIFNAKLMTCFKVYSMALIIYNIRTRFFRSETSHLLLMLSLVKSSCTFFTLNLNEDGTLRKLTRSNDMQGTIETGLSYLQTYWNCPPALEDYSLFNLNKDFMYNSHIQKWSSPKKDCIIRIWPQPLSLRFGPDWKDYCRLKDDNEIQWAEIFQQNITKIEVDELWMRIAVKSAQVLTIDLGERSIDIEHIWSGSLEIFPNLSDAETFLEHAKSGQIGEIFHEDDETHIDPIILNETQTEIYD
ncbi:34024_t:CDS:2 [Gigaspora margarita]|uniref:34024_t:CDS:1 n=1 Tax=Gigaspora margarita TaxID=4874 RepID=A0ABN7VMR7_GIGMA|nr:34024_t:CDS:2 [Gigaspora margarita]